MGREVVGEFAIGDLVALTNIVGQHWGVFGIIYGFDHSPSDDPRIPKALVCWATREEINNKVSFSFLRVIKRTKIFRETNGVK